jgi:hypothetical protein
MSKPGTNGKRGERENCGKLRARWIRRVFGVLYQPVLGEQDDSWVRNGGEGRDDADAGGETFRAGISTFERGTGCTCECRTVLTRREGSREGEMDSDRYTLPCRVNCQ